MQNLKITLRSILKQKLNTSVIVISLAIGLACINIIALFISRELNTDAFHEHKDSIYALNCPDPFDPGQKSYYTRAGSAEYMKENFIQVDEFCRYKRSTPSQVTVNNNLYFDKPTSIAASSNFFEFFSYELLSNNPKVALETSESLVISEELAKKYFGSVSPIGQVIRFGKSPQQQAFVVSGIFRKPTENSQLDFEMVHRIGHYDSPCYLRLNAKADKNELEKLLVQHCESIPSLHGASYGAYGLTAFKDTYFATHQYTSAEPRRNKNDLWIALTIGLLVFAVAMFNYIGLINNKLQIKAKEYDIRRINGSSPWSLVFGFMTENIIVISGSFVISLLIMQLSAPFFNLLVNTKIDLSLLLFSKQLLILLIAVLFIVIVAFVFTVVKVKSGIKVNLVKLQKSQNNKIVQLPVFNILQLAISIILIVSSITIIKQMQFISSKPLGVDKSVIQVKIPYDSKGKTALFKEKLLRSPEIESAAITNASPLLQHWAVVLVYEDGKTKKEYRPVGFGGDEDYLETLGIDIVEGQGFSKSTSPNTDKVLINQSLAKLFPEQNLIGKRMPGSNSDEVIGIVNDFHFVSLKDAIGPAYVRYIVQGEYLLVKPSVNDNLRAESIIAGIWKELIPDSPLNIESLADRFEWLHRENTNFIRLIMACCIISIFLSMIGLFATSVQTSRQRIKEIGIRKVNGAKVLEVMVMLNQDFIKWILIAFIISCPVAMIVMQKWLEGFAYKTDLSWWLFALSIFLAISLALITISWQSFMAARKNPVEALRYE